MNGISLQQRPFSSNKASFLKVPDKVFLLVAPFLTPKELGNLFCLNQAVRLHLRPCLYKVYVECIRVFFSSLKEQASNCRKPTLSILTTSDREHLEGLQKLADKVLREVEEEIGKVKEGYHFNPGLAWFQLYGKERKAALMRYLKPLSASSSISLNLQVDEKICHVWHWSFLRNIYPLINIEKAINASWQALREGKRCDFQNPIQEALKLKEDRKVMEVMESLFNCQESFCDNHWVEYYNSLWAGVFNALIARSDQGRLFQMIRTSLQLNSEDETRVLAPIHFLKRTLLALVSYQDVNRIDVDEVIRTMTCFGFYRIKKSREDIDDCLKELAHFLIKKSKAKEAGKVAFCVLEREKMLHIFELIVKIPDLKDGFSLVRSYIGGIKNRGRIYSENRLRSPLNRVVDFFLIALRDKLNQGSLENYSDVLNTLSTIYELQDNNTNYKAINDGLQLLFNRLLEQSCFEAAKQVAFFVTDRDLRLALSSKVFFLNPANKDVPNLLSWDNSFNRIALL